MSNQGCLVRPMVVLAVALLAVGAPAVSVTPVPAFAGARIATVQVRVAPDHADWTYALGETAKFVITVVADNEPVPGATVRYSVGPEMFPTKEATVPVPAGGLVVAADPMKEPGFVRCTVTCEIDGKMYRGLAAAGFEPTKIQPTQTEPLDFDAFWDAGKAALVKVPLDPQITPLPDQGTSKIEVYHVSFQNIARADNKLSRIYGILCLPKGPGPFPAVLRIPGAGVRQYFGERDLASHGVITLEIGIHGIPVNLPKELYDQLGAGALGGYPYFNLNDREAHYFRRVILGCMRANDFLCSLPQFDGKTLIVKGGSQGGMLSLATAALDPRVKGIAVIHPAYCDVTGGLHGRASGWPKMFHPARDGAPSPYATPQVIAVTGYYDSVNFACRVKVPSHFTWGYNDETCPPTSMFAAYNVILAPKQLTLALELGHGISPEQDEATQRWVLAAAGVKPEP